MIYENKQGTQSQWGRLWAGGRASQPPLELIEAGHIKSLCRRPSALVRTAGSWKPSASTCVCERHHSVFHEDKRWIVYCFADPEHAEKFRVRFAANGSIRKIEAAAPAGRGGTRMDAERLPSFDADASAAQLPRPEALRMEAARLIKSKNPHSMVEVKDLQSGDVTAVALRPG